MGRAALYLGGLSLAEHNMKIQNDRGSEKIELFFFFLWGGGAGLL